MLSKYFSPKEMASLTAGAIIECSETVVMQGSHDVAFTAGRRYRVLAASTSSVELLNNHDEPHSASADFFREHFSSPAQPVANGQTIDPT